MENVTHVLAGVLLAEVALRVATEPGGERSRVARTAYVVSALANNVPDADIAYLSITPGKIGYLLHHRGHTHTLLVGVVLGLAVGLVALGIARLRRWPFTRQARRLIVALGLAGPVVHIAMDSWNNYGVHPFWPISNRWFYGDAVFIVEPLLWIAAIPPLLAIARSSAWRAVLAALLALILALPWLVPAVVPLGVRIALLALTLLVVTTTYLVGSSRRLFVALGGWAVACGSFLLGSTMARATIHAHLLASYPGAAVRDVALTPTPSHPLCWSAVSVLTTPGGDLVIHHATVAAASSLVSVSACPAPLRTTTAILDPVPGTSDHGVRALGEFRARAGDLRALVADRCDVAATMRFMRAPYWKLEPGRLIVGDARYDNDERIDFADVELPVDAPGACPPFVPPWVPPREDVLVDAD